MYWKTGANDVYVVALPNGKELLLPAIKRLYFKCGYRSW